MRTIATTGLLALCICLATSIARAEGESTEPVSEPAAEQVGTGSESEAAVTERGIPKIFGCTVKFAGAIPKWSSLNSCIRGKSDAAVRAAKKSAQSSYDSMQRQLNAQVKSAQGQASAAKSQLQSAQRQLSSVQGQLASAQRQVTSFKGQLSSAQKQVTSFKSQLSSAQKQVTSFKSQLSSAQKQVTSFKSQLSSAQKQATSFKSQLASVQSQLQRAQSQAASQLEQAQRQASKLQADLRRQTQDAQRQLTEANRQAQRQLSEARSQAQQQLAQAQARAEQNLAGVNQQLAEAQAEVQRLAGEVVDDAFVAKLEAEKQILLASRQLPLDDLFQCLGTPGPAQVDLADFATRMLNDPAGFIVGLQEQVWDRAGADLGGLLADAFEGRPDAGRPVAPAEWVADATAVFARQVPGGQCLAEATRGQVTGAARLVGRIRSGLEARANAAFEEHLLPLVHRELANGLRGVYANAIEPSAAVRTRDGEGEEKKALIDMDELKRIATGVFAKSMIHKMDSGAEKIDDYACFIDGEDARGKLADLRASLDAGSPWPEALYVEFGMEILKAVGHRYIDSDLPGGGSDMTGRAVHVLGLAKDSIGGAICAAAGLVPEVGAAVCEGIYEVVHFVWDGAVAPGITNLTTPALHVAHEQFMNVATRAMVEGQAVSKVRTALGPLAPLVDEFPARQLVIRLADSQLREIQASFDGYNQSVVKLADAFFDQQCIQAASVAGSL